MDCQVEVALHCSEILDESFDLRSEVFDDSFDCMDNKDVRFQYMLSRELHGSNFYQKYSFRGVLLEWIHQISEDMSIDKVITHTAIAYLDSMISAEKHLSVQRLHLICICCIRVSAKYHGPAREVPRISSFQKLHGQKLLLEDVKRMELIILQRLSWNLTVIRPIHFLREFASQQIFFCGDLFQGQPIYLAKIVESYIKYADFFADYCIQEHRFQGQRPSIIAAAILVAARKALGIHPIWRSELQQLSGYSWNALEGCFNDIWEHYLTNFIHTAIGISSPTSVAEPSREPITIRSLKFWD